MDAPAVCAPGVWNGLLVPARRLDIYAAHLHLLWRPLYFRFSLEVASENAHVLAGVCVGIVSPQGIMIIGYILLGMSMLAMSAFTSTTSYSLVVPCFTLLGTVGRCIAGRRAIQGGRRHCRPPG